jgi:LysR family glycine cleavage system transcriptional activator
MRRRLPPLAALRVFDAAARHQNFSRAAAELHLTHGAVSHQIKALEQDLGIALFTRRTRGVQLTQEGEMLAAAMRDALDRITRGIDAMRAAQPGALTISVLPAFATHWLIPRLADFNERHPDIGINIRANQELADFSRDDVDIAVRYGPGEWSGLHAVKLMDEQIFPVCSPDFAGGRLPCNLSALQQATLLHSPTQPWDEWFIAQGLPAPAMRRGMAFSESGLLLRAAIDGLGVALARSILVQPELDAGRLVRPVPHTVPSRFGYHVVYPLNREPSQRLLVFRDWLLSQAAASCITQPSR